MINGHLEQGFQWNRGRRRGLRLDQAPMAVVELGNCRSTAILAVRDKLGRSRLLGLGRTPTRGYLLGEVLDKVELAGTIRRALESAGSDSADLPMPVLIGIDGSTVTRTRRQVGSRRALRPQKLWAELARKAQGEDRVLIHMMRRETTPDRAVFDLAWLPLRVVQDLRSTMLGVGRDLAGIFWRPATVGHGLVGDASLRHGAVVLDMGAYATTATTYYDGAPVSVERMTFGGHDQTDAVSRVYGAREQDAECLKTEFGSLVTGDGQNFGPFVENCFDCERRYSSREEMIAALRNMTETRLESLRDCWLAGLPHRIPVREVLLTGGAAQLPGTDQMVAGIFGRPCRGTSGPVALDLPEEPDPGSTAAVGLAHSALARGIERQERLRLAGPRGLLHVAFQLSALLLNINGVSR